jgi:hypothetical protein
LACHAAFYAAVTCGPGCGVRSVEYGSVFLILDDERPDLAVLIR